MVAIKNLGLAGLFWASLASKGLALQIDENNQLEFVERASEALSEMPAFDARSMHTQVMPNHAAHARDFEEELDEREEEEAPAPAPAKKMSRKGGRRHGGKGKGRGKKSRAGRPSRGSQALSRRHGSSGRRYGHGRSEYSERDIGAYAQLDPLEARAFGAILKKVAKGVGKVGGMILDNAGKSTDRANKSAMTAMQVANTDKKQKKQRDLEDVEERDFDDEETFDLRDLSEVEARAFGAILKKVAKGVGKVGGMILDNAGKSTDRANKSAMTAMQVANTDKKQKKQRDVEDVEERDLDALDERDLEVFDVRDLSELDTRAFGAILKKVAKGVGKVGGMILDNAGKSTDRANKSAMTAMQVANTDKKQKKKN